MIRLLALLIASKLNPNKNFGICGVKDYCFKIYYHILYYLSFLFSEFF